MGCADVDRSDWILSTMLVVGCVAAVLLTTSMEIRWRIPLVDRIYFVSGKHANATRKSTASTTAKNLKIHRQPEY